MKLTAISNHPNPSKRIKIVTQLQDSCLVMDNNDRRRFGNLTNKLKTIAEDNLYPTPYHHYELEH